MAGITRTHRHSTSLYSLFVLLSFFCMANAQEPSVVIMVPSNVTSCGSLDYSWLSSIPPGITTAQLAGTNVSLYAWNIGVDQSAPATITSSSASSSSVVPTSTTSDPNTSSLPPTVQGRHLRRRQQPQPPPPTNLSISVPLPLLSTSTISWNPVQLAPNGYYILGLASTPGSALQVSALSTEFFVTPGDDESCLTASPSSTSSASVSSQTGATAESSSSSHRGISSGVIVGGIIGVIALLVLAGFVVFVCLRRQRNQRRNGSMAVNGYLPRSSGDAVGTPGTEKDESTSSGQTAQPMSRYGGLLAAIGLGSPVKFQSREVKNLPYTSTSGRQQSQTSFLQNAAKNTPETTVDGGSVSFGKGSGGSSQELPGAVIGQALASPPPERNSVSKSYHTRKSSSVTSFAQSAALPYTDGKDNQQPAVDKQTTAATPGRRVPQRSGSQRSHRNSASFMPQMRQSVGESTEENSLHMSTLTDSTSPTSTDPASVTSPATWSRLSQEANLQRANSLPKGAAPASVVGSGRAGMEVGDAPADSKSPSPQRNFAATSPRPVTRKKAPQLPTDLVGKSGPNQNLVHTSSVPSTPGLPSPDSFLQTPSSSPKRAGPFASILSQGNASTTSLGMAAVPAPPVPVGRRSSMDVIAARSGKRAVVPQPSAESVFENFAGAKTGRAVLIMPDLPVDQRRK